MIRFFKRAWRGAHYLEGYGDHPGNMIMLIYIFASGLSGISKGGLTGFVGGCIFGALCLGPFYMIGCVSRADAYDEDVERTVKLLKKEYK